MSKAREISELGDVVTVDGSNVGIGTSSISGSGKLSVSDGSDEITLGHVSGTSFVEFYDATVKGADITYRTAAAAARPDTFEVRTTSGDIAFRPANTERMRLDTSGNLLVGTSTTSLGSTQGVVAYSSGLIGASRSGNVAADFNRLTSDGSIVEFRKDGTTVGSIGSAFSGSSIYIDGASSRTGIYFATSSWTPRINGANVDNQVDLGGITNRFDDIYATNGTIQTSDANEKQQIASLTAAEMQAAKAISKLFKTFKWNDSVAEKGDAARIHTGVIAQEVEAAMTAAGLDAGRYAFFISSTWWESTEVIPAVEVVLDEEGNVVTEAQPERTVTHTHDTAEEAPAGAVERTRKGIRYPQLLAFIGAATEQRLASIEARLDALETV